MRYDFSKMDADSFELMIRSLNEKIFGMQCEQYGLGPDGQREFVFEGELTDSAGVRFDGKTVGQVKYKYITTKTDDFEWLKKEINDELHRFREKEPSYLPDNYIFYTNVVLTPAKDTGVKDKINKYVKENNDVIKNFLIRGYDEICALLDNNRDVAACFSCHILPGDLLMEIIKEYQGREDYFSALELFLNLEFKEELYTRMEQAGSLTEQRVSIERVCIDIDVSDRSNTSMKFAKTIIELGNGVLGYRKHILGQMRELMLDPNENFVLIGGPGQGKTTICQFIAQIYRAYYLYNVGENQEARKFIYEVENDYHYKINCYRIPFKIVLREYAAWMNRQEIGGNQSVITYMQHRINEVEAETLSIKLIRKMLKELAWIFFFDGLDEVPETSNRKEMLKQLDNFITVELCQAKCDCMIIATTRAQGYNHDFGERRYNHVEVKELSDKDCLKYVEKLFEVMEERSENRKKYLDIMKEALEDESIARLLRTPLQATIISILVKSGGKPPHERYSLFNQYYGIIVQREKQKNIVATLNDKTEWIEDIHFLIADKLQKESQKDKNASAEISQGELEVLLEHYIEEEQDVFYETSSSLKLKTKQFSDIITQRLCFLGENRAGYFSYSIRSMQEYFAGTYLVKKFSEADAVSNLRNISFRSYWRNALLFALGYIEVHRESMEKEIGMLCEEMNGKDNITEEEYTSENICLFGSWLALDILIEDIFRGKAQGKYILLAVKLLEQKYYSLEKFKLLSGVPCSKLVTYAEEKYEKKELSNSEWMNLLLILIENSKNDFEEKILALLDTFDEDEKINYIIEILKTEFCFKKRVADKLLNQLISYMEAGNIRSFLPQSIIQMIVDKNDISLALKKEIFIQEIYRDTLEQEILVKIGISDLDYELFYLNPILISRNRRAISVHISRNFRFNVLEIILDKENLRRLQDKLKEMGLIYFSEFYDFLIEPTFQKYNELISRMRQEELYWKRNYLRALHYYIPDKCYANEREFNNVLRDMQEDMKSFNKENIKRLMLNGTEAKIHYSVTVKKDVFDELFKSAIVDESDITRLDIFFLKSYLFVARVQLEKDKKLKKCTVKRIVKIIKEIDKRGEYYYNLNQMLTVLLSSGSAEILLKEMPDFAFLDLMLKAEITGKSFSRRMNIMPEEIERAISKIVAKICYEASESNYLALIPTIISDKINIHNCISKQNMIQLEKISYTHPANKLAVKLLKLCMEENTNPGDLLDQIFSCNISSEVIYLELEIFLRFCDVANKEALQVILYLRLQNESFSGKSAIQSRLVNHMYEIRCNDSSVSSDI